MARSAVFLVHLSRPSAVAVTIHYETLAGTATSPTDYTAVSGTMTFQPGQTAMQVAVPVRDDIPGGSEKQFSLKLSSPSNVTLRNDTGVCTLPGAPITSQPTVGVNNITVASAT
jgi:hypothetical protein